MRASMIIAAHNEGDSLWKMVQSFVESIGKLDHEIVIADDASHDASVEAAIQRPTKTRFQWCVFRPGNLFEFGLVGMKEETSYGM